jgi:F-type H+-transporting ATPase subunit a
MTSYTTTFAMGLVTFIGIYIFGIKFQRLAFFKRYLNPLELLTQFVPLVSISFRLFGNILGGSIIMALLYQFSDLISRQVPIIGQVNFLAGFLAPFFHFYFDIFFGVIQAVIFSILTLVY